MVQKLGIFAVRREQGFPESFEVHAVQNFKDDAEEPALRIEFSLPQARQRIDPGRGIIPLPVVAGVPKPTLKRMIAAEQCALSLRRKVAIGVIITRARVWLHIAATANGPMGRGSARDPPQGGVGRLSAQVPMGVRGVLPHIAATEERAMGGGTRQRSPKPWPKNVGTV